MRIQQEMLTNSIKHSGATAVNSATVSFDAEGLRLDVQDDGRGFDPRTRHDGLGLLGIRERVHQLGGQLSIDSHLGGGHGCRRAACRSAAVSLEPVAR